MSRLTEAPVTTDDSGPNDGTKTTHPCFGQVRASRVSGGMYLYGSDFQHQHYVTITITRSELHRDLSRDWHFGRDEIIEVALSEAQWATFVSSMNVGSGVPCTIQHVERESIPQLPATLKRLTQFDAELRERLDIAESELADLKEKIGATSLSKKKKDDLLGSLHSVERNLTPNVKFVAQSFGEHMEDTIEKAKIEVEAYITSAVVRAGVDALNGKQIVSLGPATAQPELTDGQ